MLKTAKEKHTYLCLKSFNNKTTKKGFTKNKTYEGVQDRNSLTLTNNQGEEHIIIQKLHYFSKVEKPVTT